VALSENERFKSRTQSDLLKKLKSMAREAQEARTANEVAGEVEDATVSVANLFSDLRVEKKSPQTLAAERKLREEQLKNLSDEQRTFLEMRARMRRQGGAR
jgi:hypothetical protein